MRQNRGMKHLPPLFVALVCSAPSIGAQESGSCRPLIADLGKVQEERNTSMKAVGYFASKAINEPDSLLDLEVAKPSPGPLDILVQVEAVSINPVDAKQRKRASSENSTPLILGWDAAGVVVGVG